MRFWYFDLLSNLPALVKKPYRISEFRILHDFQRLIKNPSRYGSFKDLSKILNLYARILQNLHRSWQNLETKSLKMLERFLQGGLRLEYLHSDLVNWNGFRSCAEIIIRSEKKRKNDYAQTSNFQVIFCSWYMCHLNAVIWYCLENNIYPF